MVQVQSARGPGHSEDAVPSTRSLGSLEDEMQVKATTKGSCADSADGSVPLQKSAGDVHLLAEHSSIARDGHAAGD